MPSPSCKASILPASGQNDVSDSLLLQLKHLLNRKLLAPELAKLTEETLRDHLTLVAKHRYDELKNKLGCSSEEIKSVLEVIGRLTPRPAAEFSADKINFVIPEVAVTKIQGRWTVRLISRSGSKIRLNDSYAQAVVQKQRQRDDAALERTADRGPRASAQYRAAGEDTAESGSGDSGAPGGFFSIKVLSPASFGASAKLPMKPSCMNPRSPVRAAASTLSVRSGCLN